MRFYSKRPYVHPVIREDEQFFNDNPGVAERVRAMQPGEFTREQARPTERKIEAFVRTLPEGMPYVVNRLVRVRKVGRMLRSRTFTFIVYYGQIALELAAQQVRYESQQN